MDGITLILLFVFFMFIGVPIAVSLGLSGAIYILAKNCSLSLLRSVLAPIYYLFRCLP